MQTIEYRAVVNKSDWGPGPWQSEVDKKQWVDPATGMPCLIVRGPVGALCGYVGVAKSHPMHGKDYVDVPVDVHCGLTFASGCQHGGKEDRGVCHRVDPGEDDDVWWLGFDCAHSGDLAPGMDRNWSHRAGNEYRDQEFVELECASLAAQLSAINVPSGG